MWEGVLKAERTHIVEVGVSIHFSALDAKFGFDYRFLVVFLSHRRYIIKFINFSAFDAK